MEPRLAVIILTKNEEENIVECIKSASFADEVLVIDSGSEDGTVDLARQQGAKVLRNAMDEDGFAGQRNIALSQTGAEWVFYLDADERILPETASAIRQCLKQERAAYSVKRYNIVFGQLMRYGEHAPDSVVRLFPRQDVHWQGRVHESPITELPVRELPGGLQHYTYTDWDKYFVKFNQYTSMMARRMQQDGKRAAFKDILLHPFFAFVRFYFLKRGFMDGKQGFIFAVNHFYYTMIKYVKLYYWQGEKSQ